MTKVISLYGGPGCGKSTTAAGVFTELKLLGMNVELITEVAKEWAWEERPITLEDQYEIISTQIRREKRIYGKVDIAITDSPVWLNYYYGKGADIADIAKQHYEVAKDMGVQHENFLLTRHKPYNPMGRYQNEQQARTIDEEMRDFMLSNSIDFQTIKETDRDRISLLVSKCLNRL